MDSSGSQQAHFADAVRVYVLWAPRDDAGGDCEGARLMRALAEQLDSVGAGRDGGGFRIPVRHRHVPWRPRQSGAPRPIDFSGAHCNVVVAVFDDGMAGDDDWRSYLADIAQSVSQRGGGDLLVPVILTSDHRVPEEWPGIQGIRTPTDVDAEGARRRIVLGLLSRMLDRARNRAGAGQGISSPDEVSIFLSHAKQDGLDTALLIQSFDRLKPQSKVAGLKLFFDAADTLSGSRYDAQFREAIQKSVFLALVTDAYHGRPWCQWEILLAKRLQRPILVWDLSREGTARSFPYLGNVPVVRCSLDEGPPAPAAEKVFDEPVVEKLLVQLLGEAVRMQVWENYARERVESLGVAPQRVKVLSRAPELTDIAYQLLVEAAGQVDLVVYPDPPIGHDEGELLGAVHRGTKFLSLSELMDHG